MLFHRLARERLMLRRFHTMDDRFKAMLDEVRADTVIARSAYKGFVVVQGQLAALKTQVDALKLNQATGMNVSTADMNSVSDAITEMHDVMRALQTAIPANTGEDINPPETPPAADPAGMLDDPHAAPAATATADGQPVDQPVGDEQKPAE